MRPAVSVIVPFLGDQAQARALIQRLAALETTGADELIVADNNPQPVVDEASAGTVRVVAAGERRSAAHARNVAAATAVNDWLLFCDADCVLPPSLLDRYFQPRPEDRVAIVAGEIEGDPGQDSLVARWARSRRGPWVGGQDASGIRPAGVTANMLVRRTAFEQAGGFRVGGGGDFDLSWRLEDAGWTLERRPQARVHHRDRERLRELGEQARAYGADRRRLRGMHPGAVPRPRLLAPVTRAAGSAVLGAIRGEGERARFALLDGYYHANAWLGAITGGPTRRRAD
jgi:GT2 family glycosyltransferase